ncbi:MAG: alkane 1-monooxygenase [Paraglaciecola sp.]|jgi:alkane 1-monooxygenase
MLKDLKYLLALIPTACAYIAVLWGGAWSFAALIFAFVGIPLLELFSFNNGDNYGSERKPSKLLDRFFDAMVYVNVPLLYVLIWLYFNRIAAGGLEVYEMVGMTFSVGIVVGSLGINVAHELGHRKTWYEELMSKMLLLTVLYTHFFIEHNRGHHLNVATVEDPATSRYGENIYAFWFRSTVYGYLDAWKLEAVRLNRAGQSIVSLNNEMLRLQLIQVAYLAVVGFVFGWQMVLFAVAIAIVGFLQLETVNYIEHYGLEREKMANGRYEHVKPHHSWNSNHDMGRIFLYELTRHSDHHFKASRKYQTLRHFEEAPQLPTGYPGSMLIALVPPLWFKMMNSRVKTEVNRVALALG